MQFAAAGAAGADCFAVLVAGVLVAGELAPDPVLVDPEPPPPQPAMAADIAPSASSAVSAPRVL
ncbi:MAG: hypothetical protein ACR2ND_12350 [Solirubrobacteraceae bacterium]